MTNGEDELFGRYHNMEFTPGISIRAYLAAMAMQGFAAHLRIGESKYDEMARYAVLQADALIDALNKEK